VNEARAETPTQAAQAPFERRLAAAAERLMTVLTREAELLKDLRARELDALLPDKREATLAYRSLLGELAETPGLLDGLATPQKAALKATAERLAAATEANARVLTAGMDANQRLVKAIAQAVRQEHGPAESYRANGRLATGYGAGAPPAVSFNQVL
jgi:hypothetical protein